MRQRWKATAVVAVLILALGSIPAGAHGFGPGGRPGWAGPGAFASILRAVNLTDAQKTQIRDVVAGHRDQLRALRGQLADAERQLRAKLYDASVGADQLAPLTQQVSQLRGQLTQLGVQIALEIRSVLTPEQLAKAAEVQQRLGELRAEMRALLAPAP